MIEQNDHEKQDEQNGKIVYNNRDQSLPISQSQQKTQQSLISKEQVVEKLKVQIFPKQNLQNPQKVQKQNQQSQNTQTPYGPFNNAPENLPLQLKNVNQGINYEIQISPVLTNIQSRQDSSAKIFYKSNKPSKNKKSSSILTQESIHQLQFSKTDQAELQKQILALAKNIRQKVKRKQHKKEKSPEVISPNLNSVKKVQNKATDVKLKKLNEKRQSIFEKYSYPRSTGIDLSELEKEQAKLKLGKYTLQKVYNEEQIQQSLQNMQISTQELQNSIKMQNISQSKTQSQKARNVVQLPKLKLNFDKTHHRYQMTEFRKNILKQKKERQIAKSLMIKEKQGTLQKRRQIYNTSRYHPVGIRLSSLRTSRMPHADINLKDKLVQTEKSIILESDRDYSQLSLLTPQKQASQLQQANENQKSSQQQINISNPYQTIRTPLKQVNQSEIKSSLTFNFSFSSEPLNSYSQTRTQSQLINEVSNLTKELQNDSDIKGKLQKRQSEPSQIIKNENTFQPKKWTAIDKQMTQSKHIEQVKGLHNSSAQQYDEEQNYNDVQLQYSYI